MNELTTGGTLYVYPNYIQPEADISINNNRLRKHNVNQIYLDDGTEFQIELTNKSTLTYLAKIKLNGCYIGNNGIVLRPGEHQYLERYLDSNKKFKFNTYEIKDNKQNRSAIKNNGKVKIEFYKEYIPHTNWTCWWGTNITSNTNWDNTTTMYDTQAPAGTLSNNCIANNNSIIQCSANSIETGRVEKGGNSNQTFHYVNMEFESLHTKAFEFILLPTSQKYIKSTDIRNYCTDCGRRQKNGWKFCPSCGTSN